ncbi:fibrocystin-L-like isoform X2 [Brachyhypopomus gauderio]|uniref:fibrocystin-L-like isoform X2 n=1 Tax=Brachyhypopomus gauderio TaxID=698409 RepID=UPI00404390C5
MRSVGWRTRQLLEVFALLISFAGAQRVNQVTPTSGSTNGATRLTLMGDGFADQFTLNTNDPNFGNVVTLVSRTRSFPCDVERDSTLPNKITCYTRPMPEDDYVVQLTVNGVPVPSGNICNGIQWWNWCMVYIRWYYTPSIQSINSLTGLPGTVVTLQGRIFTDVYGSNTALSSNGRNIRFLRAYMGGMPCNLLQPNSDQLYGLALDSVYSDWGHMSCKMTGTYVGHHNLSYILDSSYGRSLPDFNVYHVSALNKLAMFQTYAEVTGVSPSEGSVLGGTLLTIQGHYFDETDHPAKVLVGGHECEVQSMVDTAIVCRTPAYEWSNLTTFPGGRGFKMEMWNNTNVKNLEDVLKYNSSVPGYSVQWVDSLSYLWPTEIDYFVARFSGFFVPMETDNYYFLIKGDDRVQLYFSKTGRPDDKVKIAYLNSYTTSFFSSSTQRSKVMLLEEGKPYYIEVLIQEYTVLSSVDVAFFKQKSSFTAQQTVDAVNEIQIIKASYNVLDEKQMLRFDGWKPASSVQEVQSVTVTSSCFSLGSCDYIYYVLGYGVQKTGLIPISAPAQVVENELNALWAIKPDTVTVTKQDQDTQSQYTITFNSSRGDFEELRYWTDGSDMNITVTEEVKGQADLQTFTLLWGGVPSSPLPYGASKDEVLSALEDLVSAACPKELLNVENSYVKYFRDYETYSTGFSGDWSTRGTRVTDAEPFCGRWSLMNPTVLFRFDDVTVSGGAYGPVPLQQYGTLCFAYRGYPRNGLEVVFTYQDGSGKPFYMTTLVQELFEAGKEWKYTCVNIFEVLQTSFPGTNHNLLEIHMYRDTGDYYIDTLQLGRTVTVNNPNEAIMWRRPPALADSGHFFERLSVQKLGDVPHVGYEITASGFHCAFSFPLIEVGFLQRTDNWTEDTSVFALGNATVSVQRTQKASPPLSGSFSVEIFGQRVEGLATDISAQDLQYALQAIPDLGQLKVDRAGDCRGYWWTIGWLTMPGNQPLLQINDSAVMGVNPSVIAMEQQQGGLFKQRIMGDFLRVPTDKTQVQVFINGIPSICSNDCSFAWTAAKTPVVTGISPLQGASTLGTVLCISGSGFDANATVLIGDVQCTVLYVINTWLNCRVGHASAGQRPVSLSFPGLGYAQYQGGNVFNFTYQMGVTSIVPTAGSITGGTILTISGYGFSQDTLVTVGNASCDIINRSLQQLTCRVPPGPEGAQVVTLVTGDMQVEANDFFIYDNGLTAIITDVSPQTTTVLGNRTLNITGTNFESRTDGSAVLVGDTECAVLLWHNDIITCHLPPLPPAVYSISVRVGNRGYPQISTGVNTTIEYVLHVTGLSPQQGSLYGGTIVTITGSGFSSVLEDNHVTLGNTRCEVTNSWDDQLECVTQNNEQTYTVTNEGFDFNYGQGYAWTPAVVMASVGDTVVWKWGNLPYVWGLAYRVFSVASPSSTTFDGVSFSSGITRTATGFFSYRFTTPGVYYYSSGYIDSANQRSMQGVVNVRPLEERSSLLQVTVGGFLALQHLGPVSTSRAESDCEASPVCPGSNGTFTGSNGTSTGSNGTSTGIYFRFSTCASPVVSSISPSQGTAHDTIIIHGSGFSNTSCANKVMIGNASCHVNSSTSTEMTCVLSPDSGATVGTLLPVSVRVNNLGTSILTMPRESARRFVVLPVVDNVSPAAGSTTGYTRLVVSGSGLTGGVVTVAGAQCVTVSSNYTHITCDTSPSPAHTGDVSVLVGGVSSSCSNDCSYEYSNSLAPTVFSIYPSWVSGNLTTVFVNGSGFGDLLEDIVVYANNIMLDVIELADDNVTLSVGPLPAGPHALLVVVLSKGRAYGDATLTSLPLASLQPTSGSLAGGTPLTITGNGFIAGNTSVMLGSCPCAIQQVTPFMVQCLTCANVESQVKVNIRVFGVFEVIYSPLSFKYTHQQTPEITSVVFEVIYSPLSFNYTHQQTPEITSVSPDTGPSGTVITVSGTGFGSDAGLVLLTIAGVSCDVSSIMDTEVQCTVGAHPGGTYPVKLHHRVKGDALTQANFTYELRLTQVVPNEGSYGGGVLVAVQGSGFDPQSSRVLICSRECNVSRNASNSSTLYCEVPPNNGTQLEEPCSVTVLNTRGSVYQTNSYTYKTSLTPVVTDVSPRRGGTAGGTVLTISGSGFSGGNVTVTIAGSVCDVLSANDTQVICMTGSQPKSQLTNIRLQVGDRGVAQTNHSDFFYIDVWSSRYTWGGESPPEAGMFAVITKGQTILLDVSTPVLKMLLIQGGKLIFDEADIELQAENILITDGGALQIGTEDLPFQHKAIITLHGQLRSPELPIYGAKTLGIREGVLDLHGIPVPIPWTRLAHTASIGSSVLVLIDAVTWRVGDEIVIASTGSRQSQNENEVRTIASVSADGRNLTVTQPLTYNHLGVSVTLPDGTVFEARAEVGVLTRNIIVRGSTNQEWSDQIGACPDGFNTGEFATQTCFQGRFGEETGSDQFGGCILFHAPRPNVNLAIGRIEYVEIFNSGQAFRLGRYPIHWHLMGDVSFKSYVRGCAIHQTYNRAIAIHNTHRLLVERNVIYNIMGGAFFIEDGIETGNVLQYNLAIFVRQSTSLLNDDVTPAGYWVTNPNNTIRHNAAAGGTHFGFWYRMHDHPDGLSYNENICQKMVPLGEFFNNSAHSQGWFGLWIFQEYFPQQGGHCGSATPVPAVFRRLTTWNNQKGAEWVNVGAVQFHEFLAVNNEVAGVETRHIIQQYVSGWGLQGGAALVNSTLVGHMDELGLGGDYCTTRAIILPLDDGMSVLGTKFVNFDRPSCAAIGVTSIDGVCTFQCGGWSAKFSGVQFYQSPNKAAFRWEHEIALEDTDGSLTGNPGSKVVPKSNLLDPAHCYNSTEWSVGFPGAVCDNTIRFHRLDLIYISPSSLMGKDVILTNEYGTSVPFIEKLTYRFGWMALLPSNKTYDWYFDDASQITNISYLAVFYGFRPEDYIIVNHHLTRRPDQIYIVDDDIYSRNGSSEPLNTSVNVNGDWYFSSNNSSSILYYLVSGRPTGGVLIQMGSVDRSSADRAVLFSMDTCFFSNCNQPPSPPPATLAPLPSSKPSKSIVWSNESFWRSSPENNFTVPQEGADVIIPTGVWMVLDTTIPSLNKLTVVGVLEISDATISTASRSARSLPDVVVLNATYISIQGGHLFAGKPDQPFSGELHIILRGDYHTPEWPLPSGPNQGSKVLGVFGKLELYGIPHNVYHTKLANTAQAGSRLLSLMEPVDWQVGDDIVLSTTSYEPWQTETRTITFVSDDGRNLTLDHPLDFTHIAENYAVPGTSQNYRLAGDVGLLSRNIKIIGQNYPGLYVESFGARVLVGTFSMGGVKYRGKAQIRDVEFYLTGQEGWTDYTDPRYSLAFLNLGEVNQNETYVKGCAFHHGFAPAVGIFGTNGLSVEDNIIHHTVGEGIRVWGNNITVRRNLVTMTLWPGSYNGRQETFNLNWNAAIEANVGTNVVLQGNIVAGYERVGFRIDGEPCPGTFSPVAQWQNNEAHGGLFGVYLNKDGLPDCLQIQDFTVWRNLDFGIYFQVSMRVLISNVTLVDNGMGIMPLVYEPAAVTHEYSNKTVTVQNALIVGSSPNLNCSDSQPLNPINIALTASSRAPRPLNGGRTGISWPTFESSQNGAPTHSHDGLLSYPAISGLLTVTDTTFVGFRNVCSSQTNYMFMTNPNNEDLGHPISVGRITKSISTDDALVFIHHPDLSKVNPSDCVDMDCDGKKKALLRDLDGSFLGAVGTVIPKSEYEWNGDPRHGLGDYRIPKVMLTYLNGSRIPVIKIAPNKGIIRKNCIYISTWQAYKCLDLDYRMLVIESLDVDTESRRLSPVAVLGDGYLDLLNGPQDHGWCFGYTCQRRLSMFHSIIATNHSFDIYFTSTSPQKLRLMMLNAAPNEAVRAAVFYSNPQRLDVYVNNNLVAPNNAKWNSDHTNYMLLQPTYPDQYKPGFDSSHGSNYFDPDYKMLHILVRGSEPVQVRTSPLLIIAFNLPAMTEAEFFGDKLVRNLALFLRIPANMIRVTNIVREGSVATRRRRATGLTVQVQISQPPTSQLSDNSTTDVQQYALLKSTADTIGQAAVFGNLSQSIDFNVSTVGFILPSPPPTDPSWSTVASQQVTREDPTVSTVSSVSALRVQVEPVAGPQPGPLSQQPCIMAVDQQGNCVSLGVTTLTIAAKLQDSKGSPVSGLSGNTTIPFDGCWGNYTDLAIFTTGQNLTLAFTLNTWQVQSRALSFNAMSGNASSVNTSSTNQTNSGGASSNGTLTNTTSLVNTTQSTGSSVALVMGTVNVATLLGALLLLYCVA